jgi:hypothetical protein
LRDALVDDVHRNLGQPVDVAFAGAEVAALYRVVEEAIDRVAVVLVVLGRIDTALRGDGVRAARRILETEALDVIAEFAHGSGGRATGQARTHHDHRMLPLIGRVHQLHVELRPRPARRNVTRWDSGIELHFSPY